MNPTNNVQEISLLSDISADQYDKQGITPSTAQILAQNSPIRKNTQISLDSKIWDNSYTLIYQAQQQQLLSDKLDQILKQHKGNILRQTNRNINSNRTVSNLQKNSAEQISLYQYRQSLQNTFKSQQNSIDQLSIIGNDFSLVQQQIRQYKNQLKLYQDKIKLDLLKKNNKIQQLYHEKTQLQRQFKKQRREKKCIKLDLQKQIIGLQYENKQLKQQLKNMSISLKRDNTLNFSKNKIQNDSDYYNDNVNIKSHSFNNYYTNLDHELVNQSNQQFNETVLKQLQKLVNLLTKQLQKQKRNNGSLKSKIFDLQKDLLLNQKQLMSKNQQVYELQQSLLAHSKQISKNNQKINLNYINNYNQIKINEEEDKVLQIETNQNFQENKKNQTISQLNLKINDSDKNQLYFNNYFQKANNDKTINSSTNLTELITHENIPRLQKLAVAIKIIQFYQTKLNDKDFQILMGQNIIVNNCYPKSIEELDEMEIKPIKIRHKKFQVNNKEREQVLKQSLMYNLAFVLDTLFKQNICMQNSSSTLSDLLDNDIRNKVQKIFAQKYKEKQDTFQQLNILFNNLLSLQKEQYL